MKKHPVETDDINTIGTTKAEQKKKNRKPRKQNDKEIMNEYYVQTIKHIKHEF